MRHRRSAPRCRPRSRARRGGRRAPRRPRAARALVRRSGAGRAGDGAHLPAQLAVRGARGAGRRARVLPVRRGRPRADRRRARPRRRPARARERVPPPRASRARRGRRLHDAPVPLPRVDLRPGREPAQDPARRARARPGPGGARPAARVRRHVGTVAVRAPGPRCPAARGAARRAAVRARRLRRRRRARALPAPRAVVARLQLEGGDRELPRVLPLRGRASRPVEGDRRERRRLRAAHPPHVLRPGRRAARPRGPRRGDAAPSSTGCGRT